MKVKSIILASSLLFSVQAHAAEDVIHFEMVPSNALATTGCLPDAKANVKVVSIGEVEVMKIKAKGLVPNAEYDVFIIQVPNAPFGMSWYQGDMQSDRKGVARVRFKGRFNRETFIVAPGQADAPVIHDQPGEINDASTNPVTDPVHTYHVGIWFNSPQDAISAGCPGAVTPFNGDHNAGVQVLNTQNFPDDKGPLFELEP